VNLDVLWLTYAAVAAAWVAVDRWLESERDAALRRALWHDLFSGEIGLALSVWRHRPEKLVAERRRKL
jgi:hypothetical protein